MTILLVALSPNKRIQPTYLPSLRYGKSATDAWRWIAQKALSLAKGYANGTN